MARGQSASQTKRRGRPPGSKNKPKVEAKRRGRPPGSKNKPKTTTKKVNPTTGKPYTPNANRSKAAREAWSGRKRTQTRSHVKKRAEALHNAWKTGKTKTGRKVRKGGPWKKAPSSNGVPYKFHKKGSAAYVKRRNARAKAWRDSRKGKKKKR